MQSREQPKKRKKKKNRGRHVLAGLLVFIVIVVVIALIVWRVFVLETVDVVGNEIYSDQQIKDWVLDEEHSGNTLYFMLWNQFTKSEEIPFVEDMEITLVSPTEIRIDVTEKGVLGYVYVPSLDQNAYFDQDGFVVELTHDTIDGIIKISGLGVETAALYEKLDIANSSTLQTLLSLTQLLKKYDEIPELIYVNGLDVLLSYGNIQVDLGMGSQLNEKILRMQQILPQLEGESGTLHMETWSASNTDFYFRPGELAQLPDE